MSTVVEYTCMLAMVDPSLLTLTSHTTVLVETAEVFTCESTWAVEANLLYYLLVLFKTIPHVRAKYLHYDNR